MHLLAAPAFSNEKVNPYNALLYREIEKLNVTVEEYRHSVALKKPADVVHFHWPDGDINRQSLAKSLQRIFLLMAVVTQLKMRGTKIIWTVHNTAPHDAFRPRLSHWFMQWFISRCNGFIFMSEANRAAFYSRYKPSPDSSSAIIPHGHYRSFYPAAIDRESAKTKLGLDPTKKILLFVGMIKPYKNLDGLIAAFIQAQPENYQLVIAGTADTAPIDLQNRLKNISSPHINTFLRFIPDDELSLFMSAADAVILPYKAILNSGALLLALSYNRPIIAPHMGAVADLQKTLGSEWIHTYTGELTASALQDGLTSLEQTNRPPLCPLDTYDWDKLAAQTLSFYQQLSTSPQRTTTPHTTG